MVFNIFTELHNYCHYLILEYIITPPQKKLCASLAVSPWIH